MSSLTKKSEPDALPRPRVWLGYRTRVMLSTLILSGLVAAALVWLLQDILRTTASQLVGTTTSVSAVQVASQLERGVIDALGRVDSPLSDTELLSARGTLARVRDRIIQEFPPWWFGDPRAAIRRIMIVVRSGADGASVLVSTDPNDEGTTYEFGEPPSNYLAQTWIEDRWKTISLDAHARETQRGSVLAGRAPIRDERRQAVGLVVIETDESYIAGTSGPITNFSLLLFALCLLLSFGMASFLARRAAKPVHRLVRGMDRLAGGEFGVTITPSRRGDEFDGLFDRFNEMSRSLAEHHSLRGSLMKASGVQAHLRPDTLSDERYESMHAVAYCDQTGGDYVDLFPLTGRTSWALTVGDVTGHGIAAAMLMSWTRAIVRSQAAVHSGDAVPMLATINRHLRRDAEEGTFLTLFFATLHADSGDLHWASAGHDPALLYRSADGSITRLPCTDPPVGVLDDHAFSAGVARRMHPGDVLLIFSDGLSQSRDARGRHLGMDAIADELRRSANEPLGAIRDRLLELARRHRGDVPQDDDVTLLIIRRKASAHPGEVP